MASDRKYRLLSIDGGGIRGLVPALVLAHIETLTNRPTFELFDALAGTSTRRDSRVGAREVRRQSRHGGRVGEAVSGPRLQNLRPESARQSCADPSRRSANGRAVDPAWVRSDRSLRAALRREGQARSDDLDDVSDGNLAALKKLADGLIEKYADALDGFCKQLVDQIGH